MGRHVPFLWSCQSAQAHQQSLCSCLLPTRSRCWRAPWGLRFWFPWCSQRFGDGWAQRHDALIEKEKKMPQKDLCFFTDGVQSSSSIRASLNMLEISSTLAGSTVTPLNDMIKKPDWLPQQMTFLWGWAYDFGLSAFGRPPEGHLLQTRRSSK